MPIRRGLITKVARLSLAVASLTSVTACVSTPAASTHSQTFEQGFSVLETAHATVRSQLGVPDSDSRQVGLFFEIGYQLVGGDLDYPAKRPQLYVYSSEQQMYQDLIKHWGYPAWVRSVHTVPRMHRDYIEWIPPDRHQDIAFITHEYCHRIIEQIAGLNSQVNFKWFDEGLAEYEGQQALAKLFPASAESQRAARIGMVAGSYASHSLIPLKAITTESQWSAQIERGSELAYTEAWAAVNYVMTEYSIAHVKRVLTLIGTGMSFPKAFQKTYGISVDQFEGSFRTSLAYSSAGA